MARMGNNLLVIGATCLLTPFLLAAGMSTGEGFASPQAAAEALVKARSDRDQAALLKILGTNSAPLISTGDEVADQAAAQRFVSAYAQMHRFVTGVQGRKFLYIGAKNWPFPIPLVKQGDQWYFDTSAGEDEILARRIGANELNAIQVCRAIIAAEQEYKAQSKGGAYAARFRSTVGTHDGLYWSVSGSQPQSPLGPLVAKAAAEGYEAHPHTGKPTPYHGYIFRILTAQGPAAPGGATSYMKDGAMTGGFAVLAYPSKYRSSGVVTFLAGQDGTVYQKDLGPHTETLAAEIEVFNPDSSWEKFQDDGELEASDAD